MGSTLGLCAVCQAPTAIHTCVLCGRLVCSSHFRHGTGACTAHAPAGGGAGPGPALPPGRT